MSIYKNKPTDTSKLHRYPLKSRASKVSLDNFAKSIKKSCTFRQFTDSLPGFLGADTLKNVSNRIIEAYKNERAVILAMGAHPIKVGLNPLIIQWMDRGILSALAVNGAAMIHDFEIAFQGSTSEDVAAEIDSGLFGMAEETGKIINQIISNGVKKGLGLGEALGKGFNETELKFKEYSIFYNAYIRKIPVTVHVAIGTDIIHYHPELNPEAIGKGSHTDFLLLADCCKNLHNGGVFINMGSNVILPEVFLKIVTLLRNLKYPLENFYTLNMDFLNHYRPRVNVVERPTRKSGKGYTLIGHHEINFPLLTGLILEKIDES